MRVHLNSTKYSISFETELFIYLVHIANRRVAFGTKYTRAINQLMCMQDSLGLHETWSMCARGTQMHFKQEGITKII